MRRTLFSAIAAMSFVGLSVAIGSAIPSPYSGGGSGGGGVNALALNEWSIEILKDGVSVGSGYCGVGIYAAIGGEPCDTAVVCENPGAANFICSSGQIACSATDTDEDLAAAIAAGLNAECAGAVAASTDGNVLTITASAAAAESCVFSSEIGTASGFALGLNVGVVGAQTCEARNLCDGVPSNEASTESVTGGFSFTDAPTPPPPPLAVPTLDGGPLVALIVLLGLTGWLVVGRRRGAQRAALVGMVALLLVAALAGDAAAIRVRHKQSTLGSYDKWLYVEALKGMKNTSLTYDPFVLLHANLDPPYFPHNTPIGWLVWHREYLLRFENAMRAVRPNVTIPYWDWTSEPFPQYILPNNTAYPFLGGAGLPVTQGPFAFNASPPWDVAPGTACSPPDLRRGAVTGTWPNANAINTILGRQTFQSFSNTLWGPHGNVHGIIGGQMGAFCSPADPVFWMHHANLDRLWCKWQATHAAANIYAPTAADVRNGEPLPLANQNMPGLVPGSTPASVLNIATHGGGYRYDDCGCAPRPTNMVMWLADCNARDLISNNHGTWQGSPICLLDAQVGTQALNFRPATKDRVTVASKPSINFGTTPFTADFWVKPRSVTGTQPLLEKIGSAGWSIFIQNGSLCITLRGNGSTRTNCNGGTVVTNQWQYISALFHRAPTQEAVTVTVNNIGRSLLFPPIFGPASLGSFTNNEPLRVGYRPLPFLQMFSFDGLMDEVELYSRALDYSYEILEIYGAGSIGKCRPSLTLPGGGGDWPKAALCRAAVSKAGESMLSGLLKQVTKCHKLVQNAGSPPVDCNDLTQLPAGSLDKVRAKVAKTIAAGCADTPPAPSSAGYHSCPAPCGGTPIATLDELSACVSCVGERTIESVASATLGNPRGRVRLTPERRCHAVLSKEQSKYIATVIKQMNKCQKAAEADAPSTTETCDDPSLDPKITAARAKAEAKIAKACTGVDLIGVDSCTPFPACVFDSGATATRAIFQRLRSLDAVAVCGNGLLEDLDGEVCDTRGDNADCDGDCTAPACGDGWLNNAAGEACDDSNLAAGDGCSPSCTIETFCYCDGPSGASGFCNPRSNDPSMACGYEETCVCPTCGDGTVDAPVEQCDDAGESASCDADCTFVTCGDGLVNASAGEGCDGLPGFLGTPPSPGGTCLPGCVLNQCGDGDRCDASGCGSGPFGGPEQCDDGNVLDGDGCSSLCARENACGNDVVDGDLGEQCDGISDAACPGACGAPAAPFECRCPTGEACGGDVNLGDGIQDGTCSAGETTGQPCDTDGPGDTSSQCAP